MAFASNAASTVGTIEDRQWLDAYEDSAKPVGAPDVLLDIGFAQLVNPSANPKVMLFQMTAGGGCTEPEGGPPLDTSVPGCPTAPPTTTKTNNFPTSGGEFVTFVQQTAGTTLLAPTAVTVRTFTAKRVPGGVELRWRIGSENGLLGFDVFRGAKRVNARLVPAHGGTGGASYRLVDRRANRAGAPRYRLRLVWADGHRSSGGAAAG